VTEVPQQRSPDPNWSRRIVVFLVLLAGLTLIALLGAAFLPRWWAQRVADQTQTSFTSGTLLGLFYGFVFTLVPLGLLWVALEIFRSWRIRIGALVIAAVLAIPNLLTLGIVLGRGSGAHAGDRILDVEAPFFRGATLIGALAAVACLGVVWYLVAWRGRPTQPEGTAP
jgi:hypothetical protein